MRQFERYGAELRGVYLRCFKNFRRFRSPADCEFIVDRCTVLYGTWVECQVISPKWPYKMRRNIRPSVRLLTFYVFSISSIVTASTILRLHRMILESGPHNRSVPDFAISGHVTQKMRSNCPMAFIYFLSYYCAYYSQTSYDDTRHWSAQSLSVRFLDLRTIASDAPWHFASVMYLTLIRCSLSCPASVVGRVLACGAGGCEFESH